MKGPHSLTKSNVYRVVDGRKNGVYKLYRSWRGPPRYVGRSQKQRLEERLREHVDEEYRYFEYEYHSCAAGAYKREASIWHFFRSQLDNKEHPKRPHERVVCPSCGLHD